MSASVRTTDSLVLPERWRMRAMPTRASGRAGSMERTRSKMERASSSDHSSRQAWARRRSNGTLSGETATAWRSGSSLGMQWANLGWALPDDKWQIYTIPGGQSAWHVAWPLLRFNVLLKL